MRRIGVPPDSRAVGFATTAAHPAGFEHDGSQAAESRPLT
jgi:hypothetical protein